MQIKVSVIVPVYNAGQYLEPCVRSILGQTLRNFELILVDDGSDDGSGKQCDDYAARDGRIRVIHKKNGGMAAARNIGLETARGEYIGFVDADDRIECETFAAMSENADKTGADLVICDYFAESASGSQILSAIPGNIEFFDSDGVRSRFLPYFFGYTDSELAAFKECCPFADYRSYIWLGLFRANVIRENGIRFPDEKQYFNEDNLFNLLFLAKAGSVSHIHKSFYHYRDSSGSFTKRFNERYFEMRLNKYRFLRDFALHAGMKSQLEERLSNKIAVEVPTVVNYYVNARGIGRPEKYRKIRQILENPDESRALQKIDLASCSGMPLKIFLFLAKRKCAGALLILSMIHRLAAHA